MISEPIRYVDISGREIDRLYTKLIPSLEGEDPTLIFMTCISMALILKHPTISIPELVEAGKSLSNWIDMYVSELKEPTEVKDMN